MAGKGSTPRKVDNESYSVNYESIFRNENTSESITNQRSNKMSDTKKLQDSEDGGCPPSTCSALPPVLDVCCGPKGMWFDKHDPRAMYADRRRERWSMDRVGCNGARVANIDPDIIADFTDLPFPDNSFALVVMDPPHIPQESTTGHIVRQYGNLAGNWKEMLRQGFRECFRVLRPDGTLIFKWNECRIPVKDILALTDAKPLFGHKSGKKMQTHWVAFLKPNADVLAPADIERKLP